MKKFLAWCVHFYTALGLVAAGGIAVAIYDGTPDSFRMAFLLMLVATIIDATDGTLARLVKVKEVLPKFDGRRLDDLIDFQTYTSLPLLLIWRADLLPPGPGLLAAVAAAGQCLRLLPGLGQDGGRLLPGLSVVLEHRGLLSLCAQAAADAVGRLAGDLRPADLCAGPLSVSDPPRPAQSLGQCAGRAVVRLLAGIIVYLPDQEEVDPPSGTIRLLTLVSLIYPVLYLATSWIITIRIVMRVLSKKNTAMSTDAKVELEAESALESS